MSNIDFFSENEDESESAPEAVKNKITNLVREMRRVENEIATAESIVADKSELEMKKIPDALLEAGMSEMVTLEGLRVYTQLFVGAIPAENKASAFKWLDDNGHGSIIKRQVSVAFDKGSSEVAHKTEEAIRSLGLEPKSTLDVHYQTFKSFAKEQVNKGKTLPFEDWGVYYGQKAVVK
jgi:hypothetical protein